MAISWMRRVGGSEEMEGRERWGDDGLILTHGQIVPVIGVSWRGKPQ